MRRHGNSLNIERRKKIQKALQEKIKNPLLTYEEVAKLAGVAKSTLYKERSRFNFDDTAYDPKKAQDEFADEVLQKIVKRNNPDINGLSQVKRNAIHNVVRILYEIKKSKRADIPKKIDECIDLLKFVCPTIFTYKKKLSEDQKLKIVELRKKGYNYSRISGVVGCSRHSVRDYLNRYLEENLTETQEKINGDILQKWTD